MAPADAITAVVAEWQACDGLVKQAALGVLAVAGGPDDPLTRNEVCANVKSLEPVVKHLGPLAIFNCMLFQNLMLQICVQSMAYPYL